jgi:hypothetical protein
MSSGDRPLCPACDQPATGNFCQHCGAALGGRFCNQCGEKVAAGAKFCNQCGFAVSGAGAGPSGVAPAAARGGPAAGESRAARQRAGGRGAARVGRGAAAGDPDGGRGEAAASLVTGQNLPWWIAGGAMFILILFVGMSMVRPAGPVAPAATPATGTAPVAGGTGGVAPDISNMTPIEAATRLFNRVMTAVSAGDSAQAQAFVPMAIAAYQRARPLDHDGLFHLSMLNRTAMNLEAALANALEILEQDPNHLLGLAAAAEAAIELGELEEAERHYRQLAAVYDEEVERALPEYADHRAIVDVIQQDAERFLAGR